MSPPVMCPPRSPPHSASVAGAPRVGRCLHALIPTALAPGTAVLLTGTVHANPIDALLTALPLSSH
ncbi:hypothetical protein MMRN_p0410 (plasmid) [Mycobacterium marinum]|nr:hypothetical protein MMRN_p0410 [Mycobacterium marinum]